MSQRKSTLASADACDIDSMWRSRPETIRQFLEERSDYEQLCIEVAYILRKRIRTQDVEVALVTQRAKTLISFLDKIQRKKHDDPFNEINDFAGVRVVCLYVSDLPKIEGIIETEFTVDEKVDKFTEKAPDQFGYGAIHYVVRLGKKSLGARYEDLRDLKCEIQIRTVLQDAWAIIDHHLVYKRESDIPTQIQRQLNSLAGALETADTMFDHIRKERQDYLENLEKSSGDEAAFLSTEINRDSIVAYIQRQFPSLPPEPEGVVDLFLHFLDRDKYLTLQILHSAIEPVYPHLEKLLSAQKAERVPIGAERLILSLSVVDVEFRERFDLKKEWHERVTKLAAKLGVGKSGRTNGSRGREHQRH